MKAKYLYLVMACFGVPLIHAGGRLYEHSYGWSMVLTFAGSMLVGWIAGRAE
jgi:hypothetical protein